MEFSEEEAHEAKMMMVEEWNSFVPPSSIDQRITEMDREGVEDHEMLLLLMDEFEAQQCYIKKCIWFSTARTEIRAEEESCGAFYQTAFCKDNCVPKMFR
jgi:hypothetical protein